MRRRQALRIGTTLGITATVGCLTNDGSPGSSDATDRIQWRVNVGTQTRDKPLIGRSTLVHVTEVPDDGDTPRYDAKTKLLGLSVGDGSQQWKFVGKSEHPSAISQTWLHDDTLLASWGFTLAGLGLSDGNERWRKEASGSLILFDEDRAYRPGGHGVTAFDPSTGEDHWTVGNDALVVPAAVGEEVVYLRGDVASGQSNALATVAPADGSIHWTTPVGPRANSPVLLTDDLLVTGSTPLHPEDDLPPLEAVATKRGTVQWEFSPSARFAHPRGAVGDVVLVKVWDAGGGSSLVALDRATGNRQWEQGRALPLTPRGEERFQSGDVTTEAVGTERVFLSTATDTVVAIDSADGSERWQYEPRASGMPQEWHPEVKLVDNVLFVTYGNRLAAVDPTTAEEHWAVETPTPLTRYWTTTATAVYLTTKNRVYAVTRG